MTLLLLEPRVPEFHSQAQMRRHGVNALCHQGRTGQAGLSPNVPAGICRRILMAQSLYAFGALLGVVNTYWSIAFIVIVQLGYAIGLPFARKK